MSDTEKRTNIKARVYKTCPYCEGKYSAREIWPHRARCGKNPKNIEHPTPPTPTRGPGKPVICRFCGIETIQHLLRSHWKECRRLPQLAADEKICTLCQEIRQLDHFPAHAREPDGKGNHCKPCTQERSITWYHAGDHRENRKHTLRQKLYNLSRTEYEAMLQSQSGLCAICGLPPDGGPKSSTLHVDHNHATGVNRALLCTDCNHGLGNFKESRSVLRKVIAYLDMYEGPEIS